MLLNVCLHSTKISHLDHSHTISYVSAWHFWNTVGISHIVDRKLIGGWIPKWNCRHSICVQLRCHMSRSLCLFSTINYKFSVKRAFESFLKYSEVNNLPELRKCKGMSVGVLWGRGPSVFVYLYLCFCICVFVYLCIWAFVFQNENWWWWESCRREDPPWETRSVTCQSTRIEFSISRFFCWYFFILFN